MDIKQHHNKGFWLSEKHSRSQYLLKNISADNSQLSSLFTEEKIQHAAPHLLSDYWGYFTDAVMLDWPKAHCMWLLYHVCDFGRMHFRMHLNPETTVPVELAQQVLVLQPQPVERGRFSPDGVWMHAAVAATLCKEPFVVDELQAYPAEFLDHTAGRGIPEMDKAFFRVFKAFFTEQVSEEQKKQCLAGAMQFAG